LTKLAKSSGDSGVEASHWMIRALLKLGKPNDALTLADAVAKAATKSKLAAQLELDRADALYDLADRRDDALAAYRNLVKNHADDPLAAQAQYYAALTALELGRNDEARKLAEAFLKSYDDHALRSAVRYVAAEAQLRDGKYDDAAKRYDELLKANEDHADRDLWIVRRATALSLAGRPDDVIKLLGKKTVDKLGTDALRAQARHLLGLAHQTTKDYESAAADFAAALKLDPQSKQADETMLALAETQRLLGDGRVSDRGISVCRGRRRGGRGGVSPRNRRLAAEPLGAACAVRLGVVAPESRRVVGRRRGGRRAVET
jgi:TolA-binding protein